MLADIYLCPAYLYGFICRCTTPPLNYAHKPKDVSLCQTIAALPEHSASHKSFGGPGRFWQSPHDYSNKSHKLTTPSMTTERLLQRQ